jgi:pimeloyl-ACP methyl ester carboxylesterase
MRTAELALVYFAVGTVAAAAYASKTRRLVDAAILLPFWPLYAPFLVIASRPRPDLLPDRAALAERLSHVKGRIAEIDRLFERPEFSVDAANRRRRALEESGDLRAAQAAEARRQTLERLCALRDRYAREITQVDELLAQLQVQSEVVRLSGQSTSVEDLVEEIVDRIEALDAILTEDHQR